MIIEERKAIRLLDRDEKVLCSIDGIHVYDDEKDDEPGKLSFIHPLTGSYVDFIEYCLQGWSEYDKQENKNWATLIECVQSDYGFLNTFYNACSDIDYYL